MLPMAVDAQNLTSSPSIFRPIMDFRIHDWSSSGLTFSHLIFPQAISPETKAYLLAHAPTILLAMAILCFALPLHHHFSSPSSSAAGSRAESSPRQPPRSLAKTLPPPSLSQADPLFGLSTIVSSYQALASHAFLETVCARFKATGNTYKARMLNETMLVTCDPENVKAILATQFREFELGSRRKDAFNPLLGHSIFAADGFIWKQARQALRPSFSRGRINGGVVGRHSENLIAAIRRGMQASSDGTVDLQELFFKLSLDIATEFFFGQSCSSLEDKHDAQSEKAAAFADAFNRSQQTIVDDFVLGPASNVIPHLQFRKDRRAIHEFVGTYVEAAIAAAEKAKSEPPTSPTSPIDEPMSPMSPTSPMSPFSPTEGRFVFPTKSSASILQDLVAHTQDKAQLRDQALSLLVAGRDTTASLLSNLFHILARRPDIWARLQAEIATYLGDRSPHISELKQLKYLQACLKESLRLFPPVPVNIRQSNTTTTLPRGGGPDGSAPVAVPAGTVVSYCVYAMHRRPDIWGDDADEFRPERWAERDEQGREGGRWKTGWEFLPFNMGPRICLGQQLALAEAGYATVRLLQSFPTIAPQLDANGTDPNPVWREHLSLTCCVEGGVSVKLA